jgi:hypothetical protein
VATQKIRSNDLWDIADTLMMPLQVNQEDGMIDGQMAGLLDFGQGLSVSVPTKIVSQCYSREGVALICDSLGNMAFMVATKITHHKSMHIFLLDKAKMPGLTGLLESSNAATVAKAVELVTPGIVAVFESATNGKDWKQAA